MKNKIFIILFLCFCVLLNIHAQKSNVYKYQHIGRNRVDMRMELCELKLGKGNSNHVPYMSLWYEKCLNILDMCLADKQKEALYQAYWKMETPPFYISEKEYKKYYYLIPINLTKNMIESIPKMREHEKFLRENFSFDDLILVK